MSRAMSRSCSNSGSAATAAVRRATKLGPERASAFCRPASWRARWAFSLKAVEVGECMSAFGVFRSYVIWSSAGWTDTRLTIVALGGDRDHIGLVAIERD